MLITNPYPEGPGEITGFTYVSPLSLIRPPAQLLERLGEDGDYILQHDYDVKVVVDGVERVITAPRGFITDLTSVPWWSRSFVGRVGPWLEAAIVHDWLYVAWQVLEIAPTERDRDFADRVMLAAMEAAEVGPLRRNAIFRMVRWFGSATYMEPEGEGRIFADLGDETYDTPMKLPA